MPRAALGLGSLAQGNCVRDPALPGNQFWWASVFVGKSTQAIEESIRLQAPRLTPPASQLTLERRRLSS